MEWLFICSQKGQAEMSNLGQTEGGQHSQTNVQTGEFVLVTVLCVSAVFENVLCSLKHDGNYFISLYFCFCTHHDLHRWFCSNVSVLNFFQVDFSEARQKQTVVSS